MQVDGRQGASVASSSGDLPRYTAAPKDPRHDEQFVLRDAANGRPLADVRYRIRTASGAAFAGITDATGHTQRVSTTNAETLRIEIERV